MAHRIRKDCYKDKMTRGCQVMRDLTIQAPTTQHKYHNIMKLLVEVVTS